MVDAATLRYGVDKAIVSLADPSSPGAAVAGTRLGQGCHGMVCSMTWNGSPVAVKELSGSTRDTSSLGEWDTRVCSMLVLVAQRSSVWHVTRGVVFAENEVVILTMLRPARNVAQLYGLCVNAWDGRLRLVLELCDHGNLRDYIKALPRGKVRLVVSAGGWDVVNSVCIICHVVTAVWRVVNS